MLPRSVLALTLLSLATTACPAATAIIRGPYLQTATPTSMVVRWRTDVAETSVVTYGTEREKITAAANAKAAAAAKADGTTAAKVEGVFTAKAEGVSTEHIVYLKDLKPDTRYFYRVGTGLEKAPAANAEDAPGAPAINTFTTPPVVGPAKSTRIWVLGDPGTKNDTQRAVRDVYYKFTGKRATDLWLLLGDNAYPDGTDTDYQKAIFEMYPETLRTSPVWPALGNHDGKSANSITQSGVYYDVFTLPTLGQAGGIPSGTEAYYSFDYANIHLICLDSHDTERGADGAMMQWLKADLAATQRDWIIAYFHHPTYTKGTHDSDKDNDSAGRMNDMRAIFLPVLEAGGVDIILTGHSHVYERSPLLDGHYGKSTTFDATKHVKQKGNGRPDGDGVYVKPRTRTAHTGEVSVVTGSAGHAGSKTKPPPLNHPAMIVSYNDPGSSVIDIDGLRLDLTFLNDKGEKRDWFTIQKK